MRLIIEIEFCSKLRGRNHMRRIAFLVVLAALTAVAAVRLGSARSATSVGALLESMPDGTAVAVIDFQKIAGSSLWTAINAQGKIKSEIDKAQSEMAELGLKLSDVHTIALVFSGAGLNSPIVGVTGGFQPGDLLARLRANEKVKLTSDKYKDFDVYKVRSIREPALSKEQARAKPGTSSTATVAKDETAFVFYDAGTVVIGNVEGVRASIDAKTGSRPNITQNTRLADALAQNPAAAIRFGLTVTPAMTSALQSNDLPFDFSSISLVFGTVDIAAGLDLNVTLRSDNSEHAKATADGLSGLLTMANGFLSAMKDPKMVSIAAALKSVNIVSVDADVRITGSLPMDLLNSLLSSSIKK